MVQLGIGYSQRLWSDLVLERLAGRAVDVMPCGVSFNSQWLDETIVHDERSADEERRAPAPPQGRHGHRHWHGERVVMEQPRPFDADVGEAAFASQ
jgi:hypothetical protein